MNKYPIGAQVVLENNQSTWHGFQNGKCKNIPLNAGDIFTVTGVDERCFIAHESNYYLQTLHVKTGATFYLYSSTLEIYFKRISCNKLYRKLLR